MAATDASLDTDLPAGTPALDVAGGVVGIRLFVAGIPVPKGRPRSRIVSPKGGGRPWIQVYSDRETVDWEKRVSWQARQQVVRLSVGGPDVALPLQGRVLVALRFNLARPKSVPKKVEVPITGPDVDNLGKAVLDALQNAGVIANDRKVSDFLSVKRYAGPGHPEGVEIEVTGWT